MPLFGPPDVKKLKAKGDVKGLIKALGYDKSWMVRRDAFKALSEIGDASSVKPLFAMLKNKNKDVRKAADRALGQIGDARAVEPLTAALEDDGVRMFAVEALGQIGDSRALEPLIHALKDSNFNVFRAVTEALAALYRSGTLSEAQKQYILQQGDSLKRRKSSMEHSDTSDDCNHFDSEVHQDEKVDFHALL